ncbi:MAG: phosphatase [Bacteroidetes bacterium QS_3_64_15]|nr:MAG: phosphatase [Bacteroidetes bacterium QS_3_64_15]
MQDRRHFLKQAGAYTVGFAGLHLFVGCSTGREARSSDRVGFGPLQPDPDGVFDLPEGFSYRIISRHGDEMDDGFRVPHRPDGMATFPGPEETTLLVRNHEISAGAPVKEGPFRAEGNASIGQMPDADRYDAGKKAYGGLGGTTTVVYNTERQAVRRQFVSLAGTLRNCAGGPTPWNSWLTCEETVQRADDTFAKDHGYVFEVPATASIQRAEPRPIKAMGRFNHEAVAVDPNSGVAYLSEDRSDGLLYRYLPEEPGALQKGGRLQCLCVRQQESLDTRNWGDGPDILPGTAFEVEWRDLDHVDTPDDDLRKRGFAHGAARFAREEGMWYGEDAVYMACTNGGKNAKGQVWRYVPSPYEGTDREDDKPGRLELFVEPNDTTVLENADNLTVAPWGDVIACEDGSGTDTLVGITPEGQFYKLGRNAMGDSELAGAVFSPDGSTLFMNIQHEGLTLAITGPWGEA